MQLNPNKRVYLHNLIENFAGPAVDYRDHAGETASKLALARASLIGGLAMLVCAFAQAASVSVDVRLWAGPEATRLVFDLSAPADHAVMTLENPDRVVVDIASARVQVTNRGLGRMDRDS